MKNLMKLGKTLNKNEQKSINGGRRNPCGPNGECPIGFACVNDCHCLPVMLD